MVALVIPSVVEGSTHYDDAKIPPRACGLVGMTEEDWQIFLFNHLPSKYLNFQLSIVHEKNKFFCKKCLDKRSRAC